MIIKNQTIITKIYINAFLREDYVLEIKLPK